MIWEVGGKIRRSLASIETPATVEPASLYLGHLVPKVQVSLKALAWKIASR